MMMTMQANAHITKEHPVHSRSKCTIVCRACARAHIGEMITKSHIKMATYRKSPLPKSRALSSLIHRALLSSVSSVAVGLHHQLVLFPSDCYFAHHQSMMQHLCSRVCVVLSVFVDDLQTIDSPVKYVNFSYMINIDVSSGYKSD
jgi:hypothetical protein